MRLTRRRALSWTRSGARRAFCLVSVRNADLLQAIAERLAEVLMSEFQIPWMHLKLTKPGAVAAASGVGVEIDLGARLGQRGQHRRSAAFEVGGRRGVEGGGEARKLR